MLKFGWQPASYRDLDEMPEPVLDYIDAIQGKRAEIARIEKGRS